MRRAPLWHVARGVRREQVTDDLPARAPSRPKPDWATRVASLAWLLTAETDKVDGGIELDSRGFAAAPRTQSQKLGKSFPKPVRLQTKKPCVSRAFSIAGAGFEPATSGL